MRQWQKHVGSRTFWASLWTLFYDFRTINKQKRRVYFFKEDFLSRKCSVTPIYFTTKDLQSENKTMDLHISNKNVSHIFILEAYIHSLIYLLIERRQKSVNVTIIERELRLCSY